MPDGRESRPRGSGATQSEAEADLRARVTRAVQKVGESLGDDPSLADLIDLWARTDHRSNLRLTDQSRAQYDIESKNIRARAGRLRSSECSTMRLEAVLFTPGTGAPSRFKMRKTVLKQIFTSAVRRDIVRTNPAADIALPHYEPERDPLGEPIILTNVEVYDLLTLAKDWSSLRPRSGPNRTLPLHLYLALSYGTALRAGEIRGLHWLDWKPTKRRIEVRRSVTYESGTGRRIVKGPKSASGVRAISIPQWVNEALIEHRSTLDARSVSTTDPIMMSRNGEYLRDSAVNAAVRTMVKGTQFEGRRGLVQIGRRTAATAIEKQLGPVAAAAHLGHAKATVTAAHYLAGRLERDDYSEALESFGSAPQSTGPDSDDDWN